MSRLLGHNLKREIPTMNGFTFQDLLSTMRYTFGDLATQSIHMGSIALNLVLPLCSHWETAGSPGKGVHS